MSTKIAPLTDEEQDALASAIREALPTDRTIAFCLVVAPLEDPHAKITTISNCMVESQIQLCQDGIRMIQHGIERQHTNYRQ
jgi:hypothetical protein